MRCALTVAVVVAFVIALPGAAATPPAPPKVTLIGDSVADAIPGDSLALRTLEQGANLQLQIAPCRNVDGVSCPIAGVAPTTLVQLVESLGPQLGRYVVVEVGYNEPQDEFGQHVENALAALQAAGVQHVWWLDMRESSIGPYSELNETLATEAAAHADYLTVLDWDGDSRDHPEWFQSDGVHLVAAGAEAMATLIHQTLVAAGLAAKPVRIATTTLPVARKGKPYTVKLTAAEGLAPDRWSLLERAPAGLHLLQSGELTGTPRLAGSYALRLRVTDAAGTFDTRSFTLRVVR